MNVTFTKTAHVGDRRFVRGQSAELDDAAARDAVKSGCAVPAQERPRTATDPTPGTVRKAVRL